MWGRLRLLEKLREVGLFNKTNLVRGAKWKL